MDRNFERRIKKKRLRAFAVAAVLITAAVFLFLDADFEKADYSKDLKKQIKSARELLREARKEKTGNEEGRYTEFTLSAFEKKIKEAQDTYVSDSSGYNDIKTAYEDLKKESGELKDRRSGKGDVVPKKRVEELAKEKAAESFKYQYGKNGAIVYTIDGGRIKEPAAVNLIASKEGPYGKELDRFFRQTALRGQSIAFHHKGSFGGPIRIEASMYVGKKDKKGCVYKLDVPAGIMEYATEAALDEKTQTATFDIEKGGLYIITAKELHSAFGQNDFLIADAEEKYRAEEEKDVSGETIDVSIEIRCDVLSKDPSRLKKKELRVHIPKDGAILPKTLVTVNKGSTVFDVMNKVCRNKNIQLETSYTPAMGAYYVEGINYIYEFGAGALSGWTYRVNDGVPNYGCSSYKLKNGDRIKWSYTCDLGKDVGNFAE